TFLRLGHHDAVEADLELDDLVDALGGTGLELALGDGARSVGDVGRTLADAVAKQLEPAAGAGRLDDRRLELADLAELLGDRSGEGIDGRGSDDADLVAGKGGAGHDGRRKGERRDSGEDLGCHLGSSLEGWDLACGGT